MANLDETEGKPVEIVPVDLTTDECVHLMQCFDACLRQQGLQGAPAIMNLYYTLQKAIVVADAAEEIRQKQGG